MDTTNGRCSKRVGQALAALGALIIVMAALSGPASAWPSGKAQGKGVSKNHPAPELTPPEDTSGGSGGSAGTGANQDCGAYCPSGVGLPSGNGNGDGGATGKPCAGCVGNADDKNPPGQAHDGSDHNNGYECDGNSGVGKTNPAHSGCQVTTTTAPSTTTSSVPDNTTTTVPQTTTTVVQTTTSSVPDETTTTAPTEVLGEQFTRPPADASPTQVGPLAFTGDTIAKLFWSGIAILIMGLVVLGHRRQSIRGDA